VEMLKYYKLIQRQSTINKLNNKTNNNKMKKLFIASIIAFNLFSSQYLYCQEPAKPDAIPVVPAAQVDIEQVLKTNTVEIIEWAKETAQKTGDFAVEQTPLYIKEYISWQIWGNLLEIILFLIPLSVLLVLFFKFLKAGREDEWNNGFIFAGSLISGIFSVILFIMTIFCVMINSSNIVKAIVAPRVVIVEKISELVKK